MIDVIAWNGFERMRMFINPHDIQSLRDVRAVDIGEPSLRSNLQENDERQACAVRFSSRGNTLMVFHDALQVAKAINQARCLERSLSSGFDPVKADEFSSTG